MKRLSIAATAAVVIVCMSAGAERVLGEEAIDLGQVIVTATKTEKEIKNVAASVEVITREQIEQSAAGNIDDLIGQYAGIYSERENGFLDWKGGITMRGMDSGDGHTLVLLDGMLLNNGDSGQANFNSINMDNVERIEIVRGPGSTLYGTDALGGVVNIITKKPSKEFSGKVGSSVGALGTFKQIVDFSGGVGNLDILLSASNMRSDGFNQDLPENQVEGAENTTTIERNVFLKGVGHVGGADTTISFTGSFYDDERHQGQIEEPVKNPNGNVLSFDTRRFQLGYRNPGERFSAGTSLFYNIENYERYWDKNAGKNSYNSKKVDSDRLNYGIDSDVTWKLDKHEVTSGVGYAVADLDATDDYFYYNNTPSVNPADDATNGGTLKSASVFVHDIAYINDKMDMQVGLRFDSSTLDDAWYATSSTNVHALEGRDWDNLNPRLAFNVYTGPNSKVRIGYGKAFHAPLLEYLTLTMVRSGGKLYRANPLLDQEEIETFEIGLEHQGKRFSMGLNYYFSNATDFIDYMPTTDGSGDKIATNIGEVEVQGVEFESSVKWTKTTKLYFNTSWTEAVYKEYIDTDFVDKNLADRPEYTGNLGVAYSRPDDESISLNLKYIGGRYEYFVANNGAMTVYRKDAYFSADIGAGKWLTDDIECSLDIRNIFKPRYVVTSQKEGMYQQPGVIWNLGVEYHF